MTSSKHFKELPPDVPRPPSDLERNPSIGSSKGAFRTGEDPESIAGDNTVEGDVDNGTNAQGGVAEHEEGRTNK